MTEAGTAARPYGRSGADLKFRTIVADPPWEFKAADPFSGDTGKRLARAFGASTKYPTLNIDEICALPLISFLQRSACLWLWIPSEQFRAGWHEAVMTAWGFTFRRERVWCKEESGVGLWFVTNHEYLTLGTRGQSVAR